MKMIHGFAHRTLADERWALLIELCRIPADRDRLQRCWCALPLEELHADGRFPRRIRMIAVEILEWERSLVQ